MVVRDTLSPWKNT
jgi:hypothetical protein